MVLCSLFMKINCHLLFVSTLLNQLRPCRYIDFVNHLTMLANPAIKTTDMPGSSKLPQTKIQVNTVFKYGNVHSARVLSKFEQELLEKRKVYRNEIPELTKLDTQKFRYQMYHLLSLDLLEQGYHVTFREIFYQIKTDKLQPEIFQANLEHDAEKLNFLASNLKKAEEALRRRRLLVAAGFYGQIIHYFNSLHHYHISDAFLDKTFQLCEETHREDDGFLLGKMCRMKGLSAERQGYLSEALELYMQAYQLSSGNKHWMLGSEDVVDLATAGPTGSDAQSLFCSICVLLARLHLKLSHSTSKLPADGVAATLQKACDYAWQSGDNSVVANVTYAVGNSFLGLQQSQLAVKYFLDFVRLAEAANDPVQTALAYRSLAMAYACQADMQHTNDMLVKLKQLSADADSKALVSLAASDMGNFYNTIGDYKSAVDEFGKAFGLAAQLSFGSGPAKPANKAPGADAPPDAADAKKPPVDISEQQLVSIRSQFGIAKAHSILRSVQLHLVGNNSVSVANMILWKDHRQNKVLNDEAVLGCQDVQWPDIPDSDVV